MELIIYDQPGRTKGATPEISFNSSGVVTFFLLTVEHMGLKAGDEIAFAQDSKDKDNWYVYKAPQGFRLRDNGKGTLKTGASEIITRLIRQYDIAREPYKKTTTFRIRLGAEPMYHDGLKLFPLITVPLARQLKEKQLKAHTTADN